MKKEGEKLREIPHVNIHSHFTTVNILTSMSLSEVYMKSFKLINEYIYIYGIQCDILNKCKYYTLQTVDVSISSNIYHFFVEKNKTLF